GHDQPGRAPERAAVDDLDHHEPPETACAGCDEGAREIAGAVSVLVWTCVCDCSAPVVLPAPAVSAGPGMVAGAMAAKTATAPSAVPAAPMVSRRSRRRAPSRERGVGGALGVMRPPWPPRLGAAC